jgi:hypothetical protein
MVTVNEISQSDVTVQNTALLTEDDVEKASRLYSSHGVSRMKSRTNGISVTRVISCLYPSISRPSFAAKSIWREISLDMESECEIFGMLRGCQDSGRPRR